MQTGRTVEGQEENDKLNLLQPLGPLSFLPPGSLEKNYVGPVLRPFPGNEAHKLFLGPQESLTAIIVL